MCVRAVCERDRERVRGAMLTTEPRQVGSQARSSWPRCPARRLAPQSTWPGSQTEARCVGMLCGSFKCPGLLGALCGEGKGVGGVQCPSSGKGAFAQLWVFLFNPLPSGAKGRLTREEVGKGRGGGGVGRMHTAPKVSWAGQDGQTPGRLLQGCREVCAPRACVRASHPGCRRGSRRRGPWPRLGTSVRGSAPWILGMSPPGNKIGKTLVRSVPLGDSYSFWNSTRSWGEGGILRQGARCGGGGERVAPKLPSKGA